MTTNRIMIIGKTEVMVEDLEMNQVELLFYPENPRVFSQLHLSEDENPSQEQLEKKMCSLDSVKKLKLSIEANDGLINPIYICKNVVLEGNSRLAAYRLLSKQDKEKWTKIKCTRLPDDISDELILSLLGTIHLVGQTPWSPFEKGCYIHRMLQKSRKSIEALADQMGLKVSDAKTIVKVYQAMVEADDIQPNKWSYYYEMFKTNAIIKADENYPETEIITTVIDKIKNNEIAEAKDIRKIANIVKSNNEDSIQILEDYFSGYLSLNDAEEQATEVNKNQRIKKEFTKFHKLLKDNISDIQALTKNDADLNMYIKQIENSLKSLIQIK